MLVPITVVGVLIGVEIGRVCGWKRPFGVAVGTIMGFFTVVAIFAIANLTWLDPAGTSGWAIYGSLIPAYFVSVLLENVVVRRWYGSHTTLRGVALANLASYVFFVATLAVTRVHPEETPLQTYDWWALRAQWEANRNHPDEALYLLHQGREIEKKRVGPWFRRIRVAEREQDPYGYVPFGVHGVAKALIAHGQYSAARQLILETLQITNLNRQGIEDLETLLKRIPPEKAASTTSGSVAASP
jgi:hypothetical protein